MVLMPYASFCFLFSIDPRRGRWRDGLETDGDPGVRLGLEHGGAGRVQQAGSLAVDAAAEISGVRVDEGQVAAHAQGHGDAFAEGHAQAGAETGGEVALGAEAVCAEARQPDRERQPGAESGLWIEKQRAAELVILGGDLQRSDQRRVPVDAGLLPGIEQFVVSLGVAIECEADAPAAAVVEFRALRHARRCVVDVELAADPVGPEGRGLDLWCGRLGYADGERRAEKHEAKRRSHDETFWPGPGLA